MALDPSALEKAVTERATNEFMRGTDASAPVMDVEATAPSRPEKKPPSKRMRNIVSLAAVAVVLGAFAFVALRPAATESSDPALVAIAEAARRPPPGGFDSTPETPSEAPPAASAPLPLVEAPDVAPPEVINPLPAPRPDIAPPPPPAQASVPEPPPSSLPPRSVSEHSVSESELVNLREKVRVLERAALSPSTLQVVEVLDDGVVLRDAEGRTVVVAEGGKVDARSAVARRP